MREASPARSDAGSLVSNYTVVQAEDLITYPTGCDGKALLVNLENSSLNGWLPVNPSRDYALETLPKTGAKVITSESLGIMKYAALLCLKQILYGPWVSYVTYGSLGEKT